MNRQRRRRLNIAARRLDDAYLLLDMVIEDERDALENTPENMQDGYRFQEREEYLEVLEDLLEELDQVRDSFNDKI